LETRTSERSPLETRCGLLRSPSGPPRSPCRRSRMCQQSAQKSRDWRTRRHNPIPTRRGKGRPLLQSRHGGAAKLR
jgi:hypothetical protein